MRSEEEKNIREYIDKSLRMSLATCQGDKPWVCEMLFTFDDRLNLYFRSLRSRRHSQEIAANPNVAGNIVAQHTLSENPQAVYFEGTAAMMHDDGERQKIFPLFQSRLAVAESILDEAAQPEGHAFYKVTVESWFAFGAFGKDSASKYQLVWKGGTL
jgi:uncharacterized protein YhbP (UPF0306 family)